jgi:hypothetical protein
MLDDLQVDGQKTIARTAKPGVKPIAVTGEKVVLRKSRSGRIGSGVGLRRRTRP